jgi:hypothetical protein
MSEIVNKVAESPLIVIDLEELLPIEYPVIFDLKDYLFKGLILKEKEFRDALKITDWSTYQQKTVLVTCSADAIVPVWAYMLIASYLAPQTERVLMQTEEQWKMEELLASIRKLNSEAYLGKRVVVKGCGNEPVAAEAYFEITRILQPVAKSIMYGEPCSTVPIFKQK